MFRTLLPNVMNRTNRKKKDDNSPVGNSAALGFVLEAAFLLAVVHKKTEKNCILSTYRFSASGLSARGLPRYGKSVCGLFKKIGQSKMLIFGGFGV